MKCPYIPTRCRGYHTLQQYYNPPQHPYRWYNIRGRDQPKPIQLIEFNPNVYPISIYPTQNLSTASSTSCYSCNMQNL